MASHCSTCPCHRALHLLLRAVYHLTSSQEEGGVQDSKIRDSVTTHCVPQLLLGQCVITLVLSSISYCASFIHYTWSHSVWIGRNAAHIGSGTMHTFCQPLGVLGRLSQGGRGLLTEPLAPSSPYRRLYFLQNKGEDSSASQRSVGTCVFMGFAG